ncbi:MAG: hypothetical protein ACT4P7_08160 [Gemmatimonadaceae bacterium]
MKRALIGLVGMLAMGFAHRVPRIAPGIEQPPAFALGDFVDDYGNEFTITPTEFFQRPRARYRVHRWDVAGRFLIAQNDTSNPTHGGLWTRIDWVRLEGMPPWEWAFCFSAYQAPTRAVAESTSVARGETPRTGCNGFPYSRLKAAGLGIRDSGWNTQAIAPNPRIPNPETYGNGRGRGIGQGQGFE